MCFTTLILNGIRRIVYGFEDVMGGGCGLDLRSLRPLYKDIEVEITPQDYARGADPQLDRALEEVLKEIAENPPPEPDFSQRPRRTLPG